MFVQELIILVNVFFISILEKCHDWQLRMCMGRNSHLPTVATAQTPAPKMAVLTQDILA